MQRAAGIFIAGIALGALIAFVVLRGSHSETTAGTVTTAPAVANNESERKTLSPDKSRAETDRIVLGDIATVPFQELYAVLSARSAKEMAELAAQLNDLPPGRDTKVKINAFFAAWAHLDANAALTAAASLKSSDARTQGISAVIRGADPAAAKSLVTALTKLPADALPPAQKTRSLSSAVSKWSEVDPAAAAKFLDETPNRDRAFYGARISIAQNWAASDPAAAMAWAQAQKEPQDQRISMSGVISGWWENDPRAAEEYVASHFDSAGLSAVMGIMSQLFDHDPQRAKEWASRLPTPEARRSADSFIVMRMADSDPKAASEWAASLPEEVRSRTLGGAISKWARNDPQGAAQWINTLSGGVRDEAVAVFSSTISGADPAAALNWAVTVSNQKTRSETVERIVTSWLRRSPADAKSWIQNSALPDEEKTRLLALPPPRDR